MRQSLYAALIIAPMVLAPLPSFGTTPPSINVTTTSALPGGSETVTIMFGTAGKSTVSFGLFPTTATNLSYIFTQALYGYNTGASASMTFNLPSTPGTYQIRLFGLNSALLATSSTITVTGTNFNANNPAASGMTLTFDDEFNTLSAAHGGGGTLWETNYYYNGLTQTAFPWLPLDPQVCNLQATPFSINNSMLTITAASTTPALSKCGVSQAYTGGFLDTYHSFSQEYGYFETRAKVSNVFGTIFAFWMIPKDGTWPPEIDGPEVLGRLPQYDVVTNHFGANNTINQFYPNVGDLSQAFHVYGILWNATTITWYLDGNIVGSTPTQAGENKPFYMIMSYGVGSCNDGWADCVAAGSNFSSSVQVDWVHAWQYSTGTNKVVTPQTGFTGQ